MEEPSLQPVEGLAHLGLGQRFGIRLDEHPRWPVSWSTATIVCAMAERSTGGGAGNPGAGGGDPTEVALRGLLDRAYLGALSADLRAGKRERPAFYEAKLREETARRAGVARGGDAPAPPTSALAPGAGTAASPGSRPRSGGDGQDAVRAPAPETPVKGKRPAKTVPSKVVPSSVGGETMAPRSLLESAEILHDERRGERIDERDPADDRARAEVFAEDGADTCELRRRPDLRVVVRKLVIAHAASCRERRSRSTAGWGTRRSASGVTSVGASGGLSSSR